MEWASAQPGCSSSQCHLARDWLCAHCFQPLRSSCVTAACGHGFHERCAAQCPECPECTEPVGGENWHTFWSGGSDEPSSSSDAAEPEITAGWRRVVHLERRVAEEASDAAEGRQALEQVRKALARHTNIEAGLKRDISSLRVQLDTCRTRSLSAVVAHGAAKCHAELLASGGDIEVHEKLKALRTAHGHALHELFAVQQQALARMQQTYSARLATLRSLTSGGAVAAAAKPATSYHGYRAREAASASSGGGEGEAVARNIGAEPSAEATQPAAAEPSTAEATQTAAAPPVIVAPASKAKQLLSGFRKPFKPTSFAQSAVEVRKAEVEAYSNSHAAAQPPPPQQPPPQQQQPPPLIQDGSGEGDDDDESGARERAMMAAVAADRLRPAALAPSNARVTAPLPGLSRSNSLTGGSSSSRSFLSGLPNKASAAATLSRSNSLNEASSSSAPPPPQQQPPPLTARSSNSTTLQPPPPSMMATSKRPASAAPSHPLKKKAKQGGKQPAPSMLTMNKFFAVAPRE